jgi:hypothetical protein
MSILRKLKNTGLDVLTLGGSGASKAQESAMRGQREDLNALKGDLKSQYETEQSDIASTFDPFIAQGTQDISTYRTEALKDNSNLQYDPWEDFNTQSADKYLDPELDNLVSSAVADIEGSSANRGMLFSGNTGRAIVDKSSQLRSDARKQAIDLARQDWNSKRNYGMDAKNQALNLATSRLNNLSNLANTGMQNLTNSFNLRSGARDNYNQNLNNLAMQQSGINAQIAGSPSGLSQVMQTIPTWIKMAKDIKGIGNQSKEEA